LSVGLLAAFIFESQAFGVPFECALDLHTLGGAQQMGSDVHGCSFGHWWEVKTRGFPCRIGYISPWTSRGVWSTISRVAGTPDTPLTEWPALQISFQRRGPDVSEYAEPPYWARAEATSALWSSVAGSRPAASIDGR